MSIAKKKKDYFKQLQYQTIALVKDVKNNTQAIWVNHQGIQCKNIIGPNRCFCSHSYEHHQSDKMVCSINGCKCSCYEYVPYYDLKCMCRHSYKDHNCNTKMCQNCNKCLGFISSWCCKCGIKYELHKTMFKIKENKPQDKPLDKQNIESTAKTISKQKHNFEEPQRYTNDSKAYEMNKCLKALTKYQENQSQIDQTKRQRLNKINEKYCNVSFDNQVTQQSERGCMNWSRLMASEQERKVSALDLLIRPHNYFYVKLENFLEMEYRKKEKFTNYR